MVDWRSKSKRESIIWCSSGARERNVSREFGYDSNVKMSSKSPRKYLRMSGNLRNACAAGMPRRNPKVTELPVERVLAFA